jgi:hypothetical protein
VLRRLSSLLLVVALAAGGAAREGDIPIRVPLWSDGPTPIEAAHLQVQVDGRPAPILGLHGPQDPLMLLVVLDLVADLNEADLARDALIAALREAGPNVYVGVLRAQDGLRVLLDPTNDHDAVAQAILSFPVSGRPGLLETLETMSRLADAILEKARVRIAIYYITDSNIYSYREDFTNPVINWSDSGDLSRRFPEGLVRDRISKLAAKLSATQTPLFITHVEYRTDRLNEAYQNGLMQIASVTGGQAAFCRSNADIQPAIASMIKTILSHYSLDLKMPANAAENVAIKIESQNGAVTHRTRMRIKRE